MNNKDVIDRKDVLLKAAYEILRNCNSSLIVKNVLEEPVFYDNVECDGFCLANDIADLLDLEELY